jgi:hypothetical protein
VIFAYRGVTITAIGIVALAAKSSSQVKPSTSSKTSLMMFLHERVLSVSVHRGEQRFLASSMRSRLIGGFHGARVPMRAFGA